MQHKNLLVLGRLISNTIYYQTWPIWELPSLLTRLEEALGLILEVPLHFPRQALASNHCGFMARASNKSIKLEKPCGATQPTVPPCPLSGMLLAISPLSARTHSPLSGKALSVPLKGHFWLGLANQWPGTRQDNDRKAQSDGWANSPTGELSLPASSHVDIPQNFDFLLGFRDLNR